MLTTHFLLCLLAFVAVTNAATWTVTSNADSGSGTLRNAVNSAAAGDSISFAAPMTITLTSGKISIMNGIYINGDVNGNGIPDDVTISGNFQYEIFYISNPSQTTTLYGLTLTKGSGTQGGAVFSAGVNTQISHCNITLCSSIDNGGAIFINNGVLSLVYTTFYNNTAANNGGALAVSGAYSRITACLFWNNAALKGGAIGHFNGGQSTASLCTFSGNKAKPPSEGVMTFGGAIYGTASSTTSTTISLKGCTFSGNSASSGSAVYTQSQTTSFLTSSSIFADGGDEIAGAGTVTSNGYNLMQQSSFPPAQGSDLIGYSAADIALGPLANNGGLSWTHALLAGSWAIDNGDPADNNCLPCTDQRGPGYPRKQGGSIDIGAYESPFSGSVG